MTSSRSYAAGAALIFTMPLVPLALHCFSWFSPTSCGRLEPRPWLYIAWTAAAFIFFLQVGLQTALHRYEAVAVCLAVPRSGHRVVKPYLLPSWSGPSG
jgi:hypothetical protein